MHVCVLRSDCWDETYGFIVHGIIEQHVIPLKLLVMLLSSVKDGT